MQTNQKVYSPLMRKHAATVSNLHYPTVDVASNGDVRVTSNNHACTSVPVPEPEPDKKEATPPVVLRNKHHEGLHRQRSRSEADILGLVDALKMLEEGTLSSERPNSASTNKDARSRKVNGGLKAAFLKRKRQKETSPLAQEELPMFVPWGPQSFGLVPASTSTQQLQAPSPTPSRLLATKSPGRSPVFARKQLSLHNPKSADKLVKHLMSGHADVYAKDQLQDTALHSYARGDYPVLEKMSMLIAILTFSKLGCKDVDIKALYGNTALHIAAQKGDVWAVKVLIAFGANVNALNQNKQTPLDLASDTMCDQTEEMVSLLKKLGGLHQNHILTSKSIARATDRVRKSPSIDFLDMPDGVQSDGACADPYHVDVFSHMEEPPTPTLTSSGVYHSMMMAHRLDDTINAMFENFDKFPDMDMQLAIGLQGFELQHWRKTSENSMRFEMFNGSRLLFLDGGGMKGLIQIEILCHIEKMTGKKITELFDWIIGTSTGAIVAMALIYTKSTLLELRQMYYKMRERVLLKPHAGMGFDTDAFEELLKEEVGTTMKMSDVREPKLLVAAVNKKTTKPELHFFNNCFDDEYSNAPVWKVARYTTAAPMHFTELDDYVDGGVLANNPCDSGLTAIQNFCRARGKKLDIACVVSVGCGNIPAEKLGKTDAHLYLTVGNIIKIDSIRSRVMNLITLLSTALVEAESVAVNCRSRCEEQGIPYYRFNPLINDIIPMGETDVKKLIDMSITTKMEILNQWADQLEELRQLLSLSSKMRKRTLKRRGGHIHSHRLVSDTQFW